VNLRLGKRQLPIIVAAGVAVAAIAQAEAVVALVGATAGAIYHGVLLIVLLEAYLIVDGPTERRAAVVLALLPLLRLLSLTVPSPLWPPACWQGAIAALLLFAAARAARLAGVPWPALWPGRWSWAAEAHVALSGVELGLVALAVLRPVPLAGSGAGALTIAGMLLLVFCAGVVEELVFRHLVQQVLEECFGRAGFAIGAALYASTFAGSLSPLAMLSAGVLGLFWGLWVRSKGSVWSVAAAHGLLNVILLLGWPQLLVR